MPFIDSSLENIRLDMQRFPNLIIIVFPKILQIPTEMCKMM